MRSWPTERLVTSFFTWWSAATSFTWWSAATSVCSHRVPRTAADIVPRTADMVPPTAADMVPPSAADMVPPSAGYPGLADAWLDLQGLQPTGATRARSRAFLAAAEVAAAPGAAPAPRLSHRAVFAPTEPSVLTPSQACDALVVATCQPSATSHQPPATYHSPRHRRPSGRGCPMSGWARAGRATWRGCRSSSRARAAHRCRSVTRADGESPPPPGRCAAYS